MLHPFAATAMGNSLLPNMSGMRVLRSKLTFPSIFNDPTIAAIQPGS
jgi:hypothetical protein